MAQNGLFPVSVARHKQRYWRRFSSYSFAKDMQECPIVNTEVLTAAAAFPIVFKVIDGDIQPITLLSLRSDQPSPFVSADGRWLACYVPSILRCYPFQAGPTKDGLDGSRLFVDETSGLVTNDPDDERFVVDGQLSPALCAVRSFLENRHAAEEETLRLCRGLVADDLFVTLKERDQVLLPEGCLTVDTAKLSSLPIPRVAALWQSGALQLIHAHQVSLSHCAWLDCVQRNPTAPAQPVNSTPSTGTRAFLDAIAFDAARLTSNPELINAAV